MPSSGDAPGRELVKKAPGDDYRAKQRNGWKELGPAERSERAREMQRLSQEARKRNRAEADAQKANEFESMSISELKEKVIGPKAVAAINRLWEIATSKNDKALLQWFAEQRIGRPLNRQEVDQNVGVTINIVRPPRGVVLEGEVVDEVVVEK